MSFIEYICLCILHQSYLTISLLQGYYLYDLHLLDTNICFKNNGDYNHIFRYIPTQSGKYMHDISRNPWSVSQESWLKRKILGDGYQ